MAIAPETKIVVERVMASFRERLAAVHGKDAEWTRRYRSGDESAIDELIVAACAEHAMAYNDYIEAVESDPQLVELQKNSVTQVMLGAIVPPRHT